ncbi:MAG: Gfo/Idh/MocA family oxidoreductase [Candidatus Brockarchaeota archaeon]|nr:Gfo/Idh/MocA family oxidoreductase [Candidatus Brockarchaeota archaeon]
MAEKLRFAVVGCGSIGRLRMKTVSMDPRLKLVVACDVVEDSAKKAASEFRCEHATDYDKVVSREDVDCVVVSTPNKFHAPVSIAALDAGKHVLCEKPLARDPEEAKTMVRASEKSGRILKTGFNHRHFANVLKAREILDAGGIGKTTFLRARTGHGGGEHLLKSWFWNKEMAGGGTFLDNGVHVLDLARWFLGEVEEAKGYAATLYWPIEIEDNGFGLFKTKEGKVAFVHSSWTEWYGYMYVELYGEKGYVYVDNRNCNKVTFGGKDGQQAVYDYSGTRDESWKLELGEFVKAIEEKRRPLGDGYDGLRAVQMAYAVYESSRTGKAVPLT